MTPGFAQPRSKLPWLPYESLDRVRIINSHNFTPANWTPAQISTSLWLDASDAATLYDAVSGGSLVAADGAVARWEDKSGNARHAVQSGSTFRPLRKTAAIGGLDAILFDGSNDKMEGTSTPMTSAEKLVVCVFKLSSSSANGEIFQNGITGNVTQPATLFRSYRSGASNLIAGDVTTTNVTIATNISTAWAAAGVASWSQQTGRTFLYHHNGTAYTTTGTVVAASPAAGYRLGTVANGASFFFHYSGHICEMVAVSSDITTDTRQKLEGYLAWKWGTVAALDASHPYKTVAP